METKQLDLNSTTYIWVRLAQPCHFILEPEPDFIGIDGVVFPQPRLDVFPTHFPGNQLLSVGKVNLVVVILPQRDRKRLGTTILWKKMPCASFGAIDNETRLNSAITCKTTACFSSAVVISFAGHLLSVPSLPFSLVNKWRIQTHLEKWNSLKIWDLDN